MSRQTFTADHCDPSMTSDDPHSVNWTTWWRCCSSKTTSKGHLICTSPKEAVFV